MSFRAERSVVEESRGVTLCDAAGSLDFARDDEETRGVNSSVTAATSPVHFAGSAMKPFLPALSSDRCLNQTAGPIRYSMVKKLLHTRYRVHDLEKTVSFYKDVLGLQEVRRHTSGRGSQLVFLKAPGSDEEIEICKFDGSGPIVVGPDLTHLAFEVEDLDKFAKHAAAKGHPLSDGPHSTNGGRIAFIDAPEGYEVELIEHARK